MAARQLGWLHTVPEVETLNGKKVAWGHSRLDQIKQEGGNIELPPLDAQYLFSAFIDAGLYTYGAMGRLPLDWPNLLAFSHATGQIKYPWEFSTLIDMSRAYLDESENGKHVLRRAPCDPKRQNEPGR